MTAQDSKSWPERWVRMAQWCDQDIILFDLHKPCVVPACDHQAGVDIGPDYGWMQWLVVQFQGQVFCPCGYVVGGLPSSNQLYWGNNPEQALTVFQDAEQAMLARNN